MRFNKKLLTKTYKIATAGKKLTSNLIYPKRCPFCGKVIGFTQCTNCDTENEICFNDLYSDINQDKLNTAYIRYAYAPLFHSDFTKPMLSRLKFNGELYLLEYCANLMIAHLKLCSKEIDYDKIVCVPTRKLEHKNRDNIPYLLAQLISKKLNIEFDNNMLIKIKDTNRQTNLSAQQRLENVANAFDVFADKAAVEGKKFLIIDDVLTTGSTLNDCARALMSKNALYCDSLCIFVSSKN